MNLILIKCVCPNRRIFVHFLVRYKPCAVHLDHQYVVDHTYIVARNKLYLTLVAHGVDREANALAFVDMARLGEEFDIERVALYMGGGLWVKISRNRLLGAGVYPLPLFGVLPKIGV